MVIFHSKLFSSRLWLPGINRASSQTGGSSASKSSSGFTGAPRESNMAMAKRFAKTGGRGGSEAVKQWMVKRYMCWNWRVGTPNFEINRTRIGIYSLPTLDLPEPKWQKSTSPAQKLDLDWGICDADTTTTKLRTCSPYKITCIQWILTFPRLKP
jgi:hypothetical protein